MLFLSKGWISSFKIPELWDQVECATLQQELQDMEARLKRGQKKSPEEANQAIQVKIVRLYILHLLFWFWCFQVDVTLGA